MKKINFIILGLLCFFGIQNVNAYQNTVCYNLNKERCNKYSTCKWSLDDEGNSGYCAVKNYTSDYAKKYCKYSVKAWDSEKGKNITCNFWISSKSDEDLLIQYRDDSVAGTGNEIYGYGELKESQDSFMCSGKGIIFYNMNLDKPLKPEGENKNKDWVAILDFKKQWNQIYKNTGECPKISFAKWDGYHVYFTEEEKDEPLNSAGTQDAQPKEEEETNTDSGNSQLQPGDIVTGCEVIPEVVRKWINNILNFVRYVALALVIALGALDFMKAAGSGEPDAMKKAGQTFMKRMIAVVVLFLLPVIVDFILNMVNIYGVDPNNIDCL